MANIADSIQNTIEAKIVPSIFESLWNLDPFYPMLARSSMGVKSKDIGKGFQVLKTWVTGVAGGAKFTSVGGSNVVSGPQNFNVYSTPGSFQGVDETTSPAFIQTTLSLIEHRGNFYLPHTILRADQLTSSIGSVVAQNLRGVSDLIAQQEAAVFYSTAPTTKALAALGTVATSCANVASDTAAINVDLDLGGASGRVHRLRQGMLIDIYDSTGATKRNAGFYLAVDNVDPLAKVFRVRRVDGGVFQVANLVDADIVVIKDSVNQGAHGIENWIADGTSVTSFFGIDVRNFGQFKSYVPSAISAALTETTLNRHFGLFYESFPGKKLDCVLTTMGVLLGFIDNLDTGAAGGLTAQSGRMRYDRQGEALDIEAGWEAFKYRFASRPVEIYTSTYCGSGLLYAGKMKDGGIVRYVPPAIPGTKQDSRFGREVEFIAPLGGTGGYKGIFKHAHNAAGATTDFVEAPFVRQWNVMPDQPNFMKLSTITEVLG